MYLSLSEVPTPLPPSIRWAVHDADASALDRVRAVFRHGGQVTGVLGGSEEGRVPARRRDDIDDLAAHADVLILGADQVESIALDAFGRGLHVSVHVPFTSDPRSFARLTRAARDAGRTLHLFEPALYLPAIRTLRSHARHDEVQELAVRARATADGPDPFAVHHAAFAQLLAIGGPVSEVVRVEVTPSGVRGELRLRQRALATIDLAFGADADALELEARTELRWRLKGMHLYCNGSMTTLTDTRSASELAMLELGWMLAPPADRAPPRATLSPEAHHHAMAIAVALRSERLGPLR